MILKGFRNLAFPPRWRRWSRCFVAANGTDDALLGAFDAYRAGDPIKLAKQAKSSTESACAVARVLALRCVSRMRRAAEVREFLSTYADAYVAERLRGEWLRVLGRARVERVRARGRGVRGEDELEVRCYGWVRRLEQGDDSALPRRASSGPSRANCPRVAPGSRDDGDARPDLDHRHLAARADPLRGRQITAAKTSLAT